MLQQKILYSLNFSIMPWLYTYIVYYFLTMTLTIRSRTKYEKYDWEMYKSLLTHVNQSYTVNDWKLLKDMWNCVSKIKISILKCFWKCQNSNLNWSRQSSFAFGPSQFEKQPKHSNLVSKSMRLCSKILTLTQVKCVAI